MQELGLMERFADPALFVGLTAGEKAAAGLVTTLMGLGTTFVILILLWGVIAFTSKLIRGADHKAAAALAKTAGADTKVAEAVTIAPTPPAETGKALESTEASQELIAVIMAAIAATEGPDVVSKLRISKIQRISGLRPAWNQAGSADCVDSRKI